MKKISLLYSILSFFTLAIVGCKEDDMAPLPEPVPLVTVLNQTSFVMGDEVELTVSVDHSKDESLKANEDFTVRLTAKKSGSDEDVSAKLFDDFPSTVTFKKGETSLLIKFKVKKEGITGTQDVDLGIFVRGYLFGQSPSSDTKTIIVSDYHNTTVSVKDNANKEINEGDKFYLVASVSAPVASEQVVTITPKAGEEIHYANLPEELIIPAGETSIESGAIELVKDNKATGNLELTLNLSVNNMQYPLSADVLTLKMIDVDKPLNDNKLLDERYVYADPTRMFMSKTNENSIVAWQPGMADLMEEGDPHPNAELAKTWSFLNAIEFHNIASANNNNGAANNFGNVTSRFFAANNTALAQEELAIDNDRFTNVDNEGILRIWGAKGEFNATSPASGKREYGSGALYASKFNAGQNIFAVQNTRIYAGIRVEIRARLRGALNGTNPALWLIGNTDGDAAKAWPKCGEIDILESPEGAPGHNLAHQTFHYDGDGNGTDKPETNQSPMGGQIQEWNIYWVEWRSNDEVAMGINGEETIVLRKSDVADNAIWPFDMNYNPWGFKLIINLSLKNAWALGIDKGSEAPAGWDSGFAGIGYADSKNNPNSPRMEVDWIRYYKNSNYSCSDPVWTGGKTY